MTTEIAIPVPEIDGLDALHCANEECGKFLGYIKLNNGLIHIKCHRCKTVNLRYVFTSDMGIALAKEVLCKKCDRFLYSAAIIEGTVKTKCRNCGEWNTLLTTADQVYDNEIKVEKPAGSALDQ